MQLLSITQAVELSQIYEVDEENKFDIKYKYNLKEGVLIGQVEAYVTHGERQMMSKSTTDGVQIHGSTYEQGSDITAYLNDTVNIGLIAIVADAVSFTLENE